MTLTELKKQVEKGYMPSKLVAVNNNQTLFEYYLDNFSIKLNKNIKKLFDPWEALSVIPFDPDRDHTIYLIFLSKKDTVKILQSISEAMVIFVQDEELSASDLGGVQQVVFGKLSKNACMAFIEDYVAIKDSKGRKKVDLDEAQHYLSRDLIEKVVDYFDSDLDRCMNEIRKVEVLGLNSSWDRSFEALLKALPKKDTKLRSLSWFSGGDVDVCQVLYNVYIKKLRSLPTAPKRDQEIWSLLVREAVWCEACIFSGLIGDYVADYLKLVESSLPEDFEVQYFPPVFHSDLKKFPEYTVESLYL